MEYENLEIESDDSDLMRKTLMKKIKYITFFREIIIFCFQALQVPS